MSFCSSFFYPLCVLQTEIFGCWAKVFFIAAKAKEDQQELEALNLVVHWSVWKQ